jgi:hypothetical protein
MNRRGDYFGDSAVTGQVSACTYVTSGPVVMVLVPPNEFNKILASSESGMVDGEATSATDEDEIGALAKHIEQFLEVLMVFKMPSKQTGVRANTLITTKCQ